MNKRFPHGYQPKYEMHKPDWIYILYTVCASILAFGIGPAIGLVGIVLV